VAVPLHASSEVSAVEAIRGEVSSTDEASKDPLFSTPPFHEQSLEFQLNRHPQGWFGSDDPMIHCSSR